VNLAKLRGLDGENAEDLGEQRVRVLRQVCSVLWHHLLNKGQFRTRDRLDHEFLIMTEEEKTA